VKVKESPFDEGSKAGASQSFLDRIVDQFNSFPPRRKNAEAMYFSGVIADAIGCGDCAEACRER
jgi:hypothetical protein